MTDGDADCDGDQHLDVKDAVPGTAMFWLHALAMAITCYEMPPPRQFIKDYFARKNARSS